MRGPAGARLRDAELRQALALVAEAEARLRQLSAAAGARIERSGAARAGAGWPTSAASPQAPDDPPARPRAARGSGWRPCCRGEVERRGSSANGGGKPRAGAAGGGGERASTRWSATSAPRGRNAGPRLRTSGRAATRAAAARPKAHALAERLASAMPPALTSSDLDRRGSRPARGRRQRPRRRKRSSRAHKRSPRCN